MSKDIEESQKKYDKEPETKVKKTVYKTMTSKFRDVLRHSQQIQTEYKNAMQTKIKRQLRIAKPGATEEEYDQLSRDPEEAQQDMSEQLMGNAHKKI